MEADIIFMDDAGKELFSFRDPYNSLSLAAVIGVSYEPNTELAGTVAIFEALAAITLLPTVPRTSCVTRTTGKRTGASGSTSAAGRTPSRQFRQPSNPATA
ncbi:MAG: hypothetical protein M1570_12605 [Chloroflexi bacterium]|nr:hypothetical protein [Chloroflexota bacterium]